MDLRKHPLKNENDLIKETYITLLFAVASSDGKPNEKEYNFIKEICDNVGCDNKYCLERMYRDFNKYVEYYKLDFIDNNIKYSFIADAFYLGYIDSDLSEKEISFISKLAKIANLDKKIFEYFYYISDLAIRENENNYIVAVLAKPKSIEFKFIKHLFDEHDKNSVLNNRYVKEVIEKRDELKKYRRLCSEFIKTNPTINEVGQFSGEDLEPVCDIAEELSDLAKDIKEETGEDLIISDDDVEWDLVEELEEIDELARHLLVDVFKVVWMEEKKNFNEIERLKKIIDKFDDIISYLDSIEINL